VNQKIWENIDFFNVHLAGTGPVAPMTPGRFALFQSRKNRNLLGRAKDK
jgi:hypothetical protein